MSGCIFEAVRNGCARVMRRARSVRIDGERLGALEREFARKTLQVPDFDPAHLRVGDAQTTLAFILTLNAINFGSGYFPFLSKRSGLSGYLTLATNLREHFQSFGPWPANALESLGPGDCAAALRQDPSVPEVAELMDLFARSLNDLGRFVSFHHEGRFEDVVTAAAASAENLVLDLARMPLHRDVARYDDIEVPFYKRAQIAAADLYVAFEGEGYGAFRDIAELTVFADNLVPHVLRWKGVLVYGDDLSRRIDSGELIPAGSPEEVEIRAGAVHAVERCVARLRSRGVSVTAQRLDALLWNQGQSPEIKARPRHRTRTPFY